MPKVSVVIPTYNQAQLLRLALESVRAQTEPDWEAIIINNFSDDETISVVESFRDDRFRLVNFRNFGVIAASRNKGIELATGEWIAFLDSDDLWRPRKLEVSLQTLQRNPGADVVRHREVTFRDGRELYVSPRYRPWQANYRNLLFKENCISPSATMVLKSRLDRLQGFSEDPALTTCEDYDLWLRLVEAGAKVAFADDILSDYRLHEGNNSAAVHRHMSAGLTAVDRHYDRLSPKRRFDKLRWRQRRSMIIYGAGRQLMAAGEHNEVLRYLGKSLRWSPFNLRALVFGTIYLFQKSLNRTHG